MFIRSVSASAALALSLLVAAPVRAEEPPTFADRGEDDEEEAERTIAIVINPLQAAVGVYGAEVDVVAGRHVVLGFEGAIYRINDTTAHGLGAGVQLFPFHSALHGFYLYPRGVFAHATASAASASVTSDVLGVGGTIGYQWTWNYGFTLRVGGGVMWFTGLSRTDGDGAQARVALDGVRPLLDASLGWAF